MLTTTNKTDEESENAILSSEYEHQPVPEKARLSLFGNIAVWFGFPMIITGAMTGSILVLGMGFKSALVAMVIGNIFMFLYVGLLGRVGATTGHNFALIATDIFGTKGYMFASGLLSTLLLGWYAVQTGITAALVHTAYDLNYILMAIIAGVLYLGIIFVGVKGLHYIGVVSVPLFAVLGLWTIFDSAGASGWSSVWAYAGNKGAATMSMGVGLTVVIALFADAGTVAADFNRWAKNSKDSWVSTFTAFPLANFFAMLVGGGNDRCHRQARSKPVWGRQHVWLHECPASDLAGGAGFHFPVHQPGFSLLPCTLQLGDRMVAHPEHEDAIDGHCSGCDRHFLRGNQRLGLFCPVAHHPGGVGAADRRSGPDRPLHPQTG